MQKNLSHQDFHPQKSLSVVYVKFQILGTISHKFELFQLVEKLKFDKSEIVLVLFHQFVELFSQFNISFIDS
jgi:hypothetical protein